ncbi:SPOR domain-containing protein [Fibrobacterota bacterium]
MRSLVVPALLFLHLPSPAGLSETEILSLARRGLLDSAYSASLQRSKENPRDAFSLFMLAKLTLDGSQSTGFFDKVMKISEDADKKEEAMYRTAQYHYARGDYPRAISFFRKNISKYPRGNWIVSARYWMGQACLNHGLTSPAYVDSAESQYLILLQSLPVRHYYYTMALEGLAKVRLAKNQIEMAIETINMALETAPSDQRSNLRYLSFIIAGRMSDYLSQDFYAEKLLSEYPHSLESGYLLRKYPEFKRFLGKDAGPGKGVGFFLQIGAFASLKNAEKTEKELKARKISVSIVVSENDKGKMYLLHTDSFPSRKSAERYGEKNLKPLGISYYPVQKN